MDVQTFVQNVKLLCAARGISPTSACKESGVGTSFIPDIKRGRIPSIDKFEKLALYLGVTISELLGETRTDLAVVSYDVPPKDTIEEVFEVIDLMKGHILSDFRTFVNASNPPISSKSAGPYSFVLEAKLQSYTHTPISSTEGVASDTSSPKEAELIDLYRKLAPAQQDTLLEVAQALVSKNDHL
ncbi:helix-turn-helix domain-containing protein [Flavonifractor sp. An82]|uniref:helix-turn-helix domain-containing protein n=1 Tax=Flavonifractor sp. An82 TaxID=1965660 RepID=UPI0013A6539D|nr:helix-turn-helix transcriptional regulator [Flavonifractor sp. An82]